MSSSKEYQKTEPDRVPQMQHLKKRCDFQRAAVAAAWFRAPETTGKCQGTVGAKHQMCPSPPVQSLPFEAPGSPGAGTEVYPLFPAVPPPCLLLVPCRPETTSS